MEDGVHSPDTHQAIPSGNLSFSHLVAGFLLLVVVALMGWSYYQRYALNQELASVEAEITDTQGQLNALNEKQLDSIIISQQTVDQVEASAIIWSKVMSTLMDVTPLDVFYRSYSASTDGKMSLSVITDSYDSAANLISILDNHEDFLDPFVSSLTQGTTDSGSGVVTFGITFNAN